MLGKDISTSRRVVHQLLNMPNSRDRGNTHGMPPPTTTTHIVFGMCVRFIHALSRVVGLMKERQGTGEHLVLHPENGFRKNTVMGNHNGDPRTPLAKKKCFYSIIELSGKKD